MISEDSLKFWAKAPGKTERDKMLNAEVSIKKAISADNELSKMDISVIKQGSYRSRTNIRQNSDVDICVCLNSTFFTHYPAGKTNEDYGNNEGTISFSTFKSMVQKALGNYYGYGNITPGSKAFDIHSNNYRVDADVVPAFAYRYYFTEGHDSYVQPTGIAFNSTDGTRIVNWPRQVYKNGKIKQNNTGLRYKKMVRILKKIRDKMQSEGIVEANNVGSFQIESMVWNVPDLFFNNATYTEDIKNVIAQCWSMTKEDGEYASLYEVNGRKKLFGPHQPWTREDSHVFFQKAWSYCQFK